MPTLPDLHTLIGFAGLTLVIGGMGAIATGRAVARGWQSLWLLFVYICFLVAAVRFLHFALWQERLFSANAAIVDLATLLMLAWLSFAATRKRQMRRQYGWLTPGGR